MDIQRDGSKPSGQGPGDWLTGAVRIDPLFEAPAPGRVAGASVTFEPGARAASHTHPLGQTLIVTGGCGWAQRDGGPVEVIRPGDVVWFPPGGEALAWGDGHDGDDAHRHCERSSTAKSSSGWSAFRKNSTVRGFRTINGFCDLILAAPRSPA